MTGSQIDRKFSAVLEGIEAAAWAQHQLASPPEILERFAIEVGRVGGATILYASRADMVGMNRVLGLGLDDDERADTVVDEIIDNYARRGIGRFVVQLSPLAGGAVRTALEARGMKPISRLAKLYWRAGHADSLSARDVEVRVVDAGCAALYGRVVARGHGDPAELAAAHAATVGRPRWTHYLVFAEGSPIAGATLFCEEGIAWCGFGSTLPEARRRGAHSALLARRIADAEALGCSTIVCETAEETAERPNPAYRNMQRAGFDLAYLRENLLYLAPEKRTPPTS